MSHLVTAHRSKAKVAAQCAGKNSCTVRIPSMQLQGDEATQIVWRRNRECRPACAGVVHLLEERPQDTQPLSAGVLRETSGALHMLIKATKFVLDRASRITSLGQYTEIFKHRQQNSESRANLIAATLYRWRTSAMYKVIIEKPLNVSLSQIANGKPTPSVYPSCEMRNAVQV